MKKTVITTLIIIIIACIQSLSFAIDDEQKLVVATVGSSVTAGIVGYSQAEIDDSVNDGIFERIKKTILNSNNFFNYRCSNFSLADIFTRKTKEYNKLTVTNGFDAFATINTSYLYLIKMPDLIALHLYKLINDPLFYIILQLHYAEANSANIVVGIDMFFWVIYSAATDDLETEDSDIKNHKKIKTLQQILNLLNNNYNSKVHFILGNIPQFSFISLGSKCAYSSAIVDYANNILQEWVASRNHSKKANSILIDVTITYKQNKIDNTPFQLHEDMPAYTINEILSTDDLHLSVKGMNILVTYIAKNLIHSNIDVLRKLGIMLDNDSA